MSDIVISAVETEVIELLKDVPAAFEEAVIQAIPHDIEAGIYAGWVLFKTYFEILQWAISVDNPGALAAAVGIGNDWMNEVESVVTEVSGSSIIKAMASSSTLFQGSRQLLESDMPYLESLGYAPVSPVTKAVLTVLVPKLVAPATPVTPVSTTVVLGPIVTTPVAPGDPNTAPADPNATP